LYEISGLPRRVWVEKSVNNHSTVFVTVSAITTLAHHWVHKPVNITRPLEECSVVKRFVNHWMHKPVNIRRRLNSCAICMPKNVYSIFCSKAYSQLQTGPFCNLLARIHDHVDKTLSNFSTEMQCTAVMGVSKSITGGTSKIAFSVSTH